MITLDDSIKRDINNAFDEGFPMIVCGVTPEGEPAVSWRGTVSTVGDDRLGFWVRRGDKSATLNLLKANPTLVLVYTNLPVKRFYMFRGKGRPVEDDALRNQVYDNSPETERNSDPERQGIAVIVDLESVRGRGAEGLVNMKV